MVSQNKEIKPKWIVTIHHEMNKQMQKKIWGYLLQE